MRRKLCLYVANFNNFVFHHCFNMVPRWFFWCYTCRKNNEKNKLAKVLNTTYSYCKLLRLTVSRSEIHVDLVLMYKETIVEMSGHLSFVKRRLFKSIWRKYFERGYRKFSAESFHLRAFHLMQLQRLQLSAILPNE